jgi:hypothetical protein
MVDAVLQPSWTSSDGGKPGLLDGSDKQRRGGERHPVAAPFEVRER